MRARTHFTDEGAMWVCLEFVLGGAEKGWQGLASRAREQPQQSQEIAKSEAHSGSIGLSSWERMMGSFKRRYNSMLEW